MKKITFLFLSILLSAISVSSTTSCFSKISKPKLHFHNHYHFDNADNNLKFLQDIKLKLTADPIDGSDLKENMWIDLDLKLIEKKIIKEINDERIKVNVVVSMQTIKTADYKIIFNISVNHSVFKNLSRQLTLKLINVKKYKQSNYGSSKSNSSYSNSWNYSYSKPNSNYSNYSNYGYSKPKTTEETYWENYDKYQKINQKLKWIKSKRQVFMNWLV